MRKKVFESELNPEASENNRKEKIKRLADTQVMEIKKLFKNNNIDLCLDKKYISEDLMDLDANDYKDKMAHIIPRNENGPGIIKNIKRLKEKCFTDLAKDIKEADKNLDDQDIINILQEVFQNGKRIALEEIVADNCGKYDMKDSRHERLLAEYTDMLALETARSATEENKWGIIKEAKKAYNNKDLVYDETAFVDLVNKYVEQGAVEDFNATKETQS